MQRINLYPSPLTPLVNDGTGDITHGDYDVAIDNLEAGTYVFAADIQNSGTQTGINVMLFDRADLHGDRGQSALAVVGQHRPSTADGRIHMFGCHRGCAGACGADERRCHVQRRFGNHEEPAPVEQGIAHGRRCEGPARMPRNLLGRRLDCPSDGRRQLLRQGYGNLLALISLGVAARESGIFMIRRP